MSQVLHHSPQPSQAISEMFRILQPGGRFLIIDLIQHDQEWMRDKLGDLWLGFDPEEVLSLVQQHDPQSLKFKKMSITNGLPLFLITGVKK
jgi:ubiquinone/menaquinone biosynthesis C-methylase UbiE